MPSRRSIQRLTLVCIGFLLTTPGCFLRAASDTVLHIRIPDASDPLQPDELTWGLRNVKWDSSDEGDFLVGTGFHHREHETYMFLGSEGYPSGPRRYIRVTPIAGKAEEAAQHRLELLVCPWWYRPASGSGQDAVRFVGLAPSPVSGLFWTRRIELDDVELVSTNPPQSILVSGIIIAKPGSPEDLEWLDERYEHTLQLSEETTPPAPEQPVLHLTAR